MPLFVLWRLLNIFDASPRRFPRRQFAVRFFYFLKIFKDVIMPLIVPVKLKYSVRYS